MESVQEIMDKCKIGYSFPVDGESEDGEEINEKTTEKYLEAMEKLNEISENFEVVIDIPIASILEAVRRMVNRGDIILDYNMRDVLRETNIINEIWEKWIPDDDFGKESKQMVSSIIENMENEE